MPKTTRVDPVYVELIPSEKEQGKLYISEKYAIAVHLCACGCGNKTVTTLNLKERPLPGWDIQKATNGEVSLSPSIGNFSFPCRSHYWIKENEIIWC